MQARVRFVHGARSPLRRSCALSARSAGESAICPRRAQPSAEIARVECAKCRRECDLSPARANPLRRSRASSARNAGESAICRARGQPSAECRVRETQARARLVLDAGNPLRRSRVSSARNAGETESAICPARGQPSAEIVVVECAKCKRGHDLSCPRATLCRDRACRVRETQARARFGLRAGADMVRVECAKRRRQGEELADV